MRQYAFTPLINLHPSMDELIKWATANFRDVENSSRVDVVTDVAASGAKLVTIANAPANSIPFFTNSTTVTTITLGGSNGVFGASGASHSVGLVPDPGGSAGTTRFLREDATFAVPPTFIASGGSHAPGYVPDPGASAGTTKFLREDATWQPDAVFVASGAGHAAGDVPDPGSVAGTTRYLREDATWVTAIPDPGAWTSYTPSFVPNTGAFTTSSATGKWVQLGKTIHFSVTLTLTTNGTGGGFFKVGLPIAVKTAATAVGRETAGITGKVLGGTIQAGNLTMIVLNYDNSYPGADGTTYVISGTYETT